MDHSSKLFWASLDFINLKRLLLLKKHFGEIENVPKNISKKELLELGIQEKSANVFLKKRAEMNLVDIEKKFQTSRSKIIFYEEEEFPAVLRNIPDPPIFLFVRGAILLEDNISLAVVGTRKCSSYGKRILAHILPDIVSAGFTLISGMASGIDTEVHKIALRRAGRTLAVWGTGIDVPYPAQNAKLAHEIEESGAIISEFPLGTPPDPYNFPRRNRLISGLSLGTLVIEAQEKSGSLITARLALEQGKEVFAVPGSLFSDFSLGPNRLLQKGEAKLVCNSSDILEEFSFVAKNPEVRKFLPENIIQKIVFEILPKEGMSFDDLVFQCKRSSGEISSALLLMSMKGVVTDLGMNQWARNF